jgi:hypothetical protein
MALVSVSGWNWEALSQTLDANGCVPDDDRSGADDLAVRAGRD